MLREPDCIFCKLVAAEIPAAVVYENDALIAFLDNGPLADGHLLITPREHFERLSDVPPDTCALLARAMPLLVRAMSEVVSSPGCNVLLNDGKVAGQEVPHVHFHLIPRRENDSLGYRWSAQTYAEGRAASIAMAYQKAIREAID